MRNGLIAAGAVAVIAAVVVPLAVSGSGKAGPSVQAAASYAVPATTTQARAATALAILDELRSGDFSAVRRGFDATMAAGLSEAGVAAGWAQFVSQFGAYRSHGTPTESQAGSFFVVQVPLSMASRPGELRVSFDSAGRIAGLYLLRPGVPPGQTGAPSPEPSAAAAATARSVLDDLVRGDYLTLETSFDPTMKAAVGQDQLKSAWQQLSSQLGAYRSAGTPFVVPVSGAVLYEFPLQFANGPGHLQVAVDANGQVAGLYLKPGNPTGAFGR